MSSPFPGDWAQYVTSVGPTVTSDDVDLYGRLAAIDAWGRQQKGEHALRLVYGFGLFVALVGQLIAIFTIAFLIGYDVIKLDRWVATAFAGGAFAETTAMTLVVVRHLFPNRSS